MTRVRWTGAAAAGSARATASASRSYQWTNRLGRAEEMGAVEGELYRRASTDPVLARQVLDVMARTRAPTAVLTPARKLSLAMAAARRGPDARLAVAGEVWQELRDGMAERGERLRFGLRRRPGRAGAGARRGPAAPRPRAALDAG